MWLFWFFNALMHHSSPCIRIITLVLQRAALPFITLLVFGWPGMWKWLGKYSNISGASTGRSPRKPEGPWKLLCHCAGDTHVKPRPASPGQGKALLLQGNGIWAQLCTGFRVVLRGTSGKECVQLEFLTVRARDCVCVCAEHGSIAKHIFNSLTEVTFWVNHSSNHPPAAAGSDLLLLRSSGAKVLHEAGFYRAFTKLCFSALSPGESWDFQ